MSEVTDLSARIARLQEQIAQDQAQLLTARQEFRDRLVARLEFGISQKQQQLAEVQGQLAQAQQRDAQGTASSGQIVAQTPGTVSTVLEPTGRVTAQDRAGTETGTNAPVRPLTQTQSTPPAAPLLFTRDEDGNLLPPTTTTAGGAGAPSDDNTTKNSLSVQQTINANFSQRINPRPNILDQYASYTYSLTWYLLTPQQFNSMSVQNKINISEWQILVQSAGAPLTPGNGLPGRNEFFSSDYYMDNLVIEQVLAGKGSGSVQNFGSLNFTLTEPNGAVFLENLKNAVTAVYKQNNVSGGVASFVGAQYVMCVRFYGYNQAGQLVQVGKNANPGNGNSVPTDASAVVEKFIPFNLSDIKFKLVNRVIEYRIEAVGTPYITAFSSQRGTIPFDYELTGSNVGEVLNGRPTGTKYSRSDGRVDSADPPSANPTSPVNPGNQAGVDQFGNFTGSTESPFLVVAP
jgi:hypothetical protein